MQNLIPALLSLFTKAKRTLSTDEKYVIDFAADIVSEQVKPMPYILSGSWCQYADCFVLTKVSPDGIKTAVLTDEQVENAGIELQVRVSEYGMPDYNSPDGYGKYLGVTYEDITIAEKYFTQKDFERLASFADKNNMWV